MTWKDWGLFILSAYGAALSTVNAFNAFRKERRLIQVNCGQKHPIGGYRPAADVHAHITATNIGSRPVTVRALGLLLPNSKRFVAIQPCQKPGMEDTPLAAKLSDGETAEAHFAYVDIASTLSNAGYDGRLQLVPFCEDSAGRIHRGRVWDTSVRELVSYVGK
ncbi:hypothetical protein JQ615_18385 [Bradyrhizobium jicamae]|uniref:Uncharacterized protein n=1 Tax=Bradyrhizobium jicamae TaxID=280332 RepID=A0ABS5FKQ5_9BRAD|nr:hypothetical protein [Bradyrhizobium jicamae]MBR0797359.1 hypothetical protein [Bradyrhizobium jicamae]